jgi:hypothetical protein
MLKSWRSASTEAAGRVVVGALSVSGEDRDFVFATSLQQADVRLAGGR